MATILKDVVDYIAELPMLAKSMALIFAVAIEYVFPVFPGDTIVLLAGFLNAQGAFDLAQAMLSIIVGSLLGTFLGYKIGAYFLKEPYRYAWARKLAQSSSYRQFNIWYQKWGSWLLLFNRFIHGIRAIFFMAAGAYRLPLPKVLALGLCGAIIFNGCLLLLGYWLGYDTERVIAYFYRFNVFIYGATCVVLILVVYYWRKNKVP